MVESIKDMFYFGKDIGLVTPDEEDRMPDFHRRHAIAYIRSWLGASQVEAADGYEDGLRRIIDEIPPLVEEILKGSEYPIDKLAFVNRVIPEVEKVIDIATKTLPQYAKEELPQHLDALYAMRDALANPAPAHEQPALTM